MIKKPISTLLYKRNRKHFSTRLHTVKDENWDKQFLRLTAPLRAVCGDNVIFHYRQNKSGKV